MGESFVQAGDSAAHSNAQQAISAEQKQFADTLGNSLAEKWLQDHTAGDNVNTRPDAEQRLTG